MKTKHRKKRPRVGRVGRVGRLSIRASATDPANRRIELVAAVNITAAAAGDDGKPKGPARFDMVAYTGGAMRLKGWQFPVVVDLEGVEAPGKFPALSDHDMSRAGIVGHVDDLKIRKGGAGGADGYGIDAGGVISGAGPAAAEVRESGKNGFPWQASIGAQVLKNQFVPEGQTAMANGQVWQGPINVARRSALGEISFVPRGADSNTSARVAARSAERRSAAKGFGMTFEEWLKARGLTLGELKNPALKASLQAAFDAEMITAGGEDDDDVEGEEETPAKARKGKKIIAAKGKKGKKIAAAIVENDDDAGEDEETDPVGDLRASYAADLERIGKIRDLCGGRHPQIEAQAVKEGWTSEKVELEVLRASRPVAAPYINTGAGSGSDNPQVLASAISAAGAMSAGVNEKTAFAGLSDQVKEIAASRKLRGVGLHQIMFMVAAAHGVHLTPGRIDDDSLRAIIRLEHQIQAADGGGFSTISLSGITENILNKAMLQAYSDVASVVSDIAFETDTNDFKTYKRYRLTGSGAFQDVGPNGELKNMSLQDEAFSNKLGTKGAIINLGRELLINDDMGAIVQLPQLLGRQGALARERAVFTQILANAAQADTFAFFSANHANYASGAGSALQISSVTTAEKIFLEQKDANGDPIMLTPDRILAPPALKATAENLFNGANLVVGALGSTASKSVEPNRNPHEGKYRPVISPFLGTQGGITGKSDTGWYLLPPPVGGMAIAQVGYLRGQRVPVIERGEANFNTLGISMRAFFDFGVSMHDNRCGVFSAGA